MFSHVFKAEDKLNPGQMVVVKIYRSHVSGTNFAAHAQEEINLLQNLAKVDKDIEVIGIFVCIYI